MTQTPCLWFDTQGEEAARFYCSVFPNSRITAITHYAADAPQPQGQVLTVEFELDGSPYVALNGGPQYTFTEAVSFYVMCADQDEVDHYWDGLVEGGGEHGPCGWLKDRYGLSWQVCPTRMMELLKDPDPARSQRAMQAMMGMGKLVIADLERAADG